VSNLGYPRKAVLPLVSFIFGAAVLILSAAGVSAQATGKADFQGYCASCHGINATGGKGSEIPDPGPDLTHLSKKNGGTFPFQQVYDVIDGRKLAAAHQRLLDMPLWGVYFQPPGASAGASEAASEAKVKSRITDLVRYIESLQKN
jgi:mono/diheme cytochrome c family protein